MRPNRRGRKGQKPVRTRRHPGPAAEERQSKGEAAEGAGVEATMPTAAVVGVPLSMDPRETKLLREMLWQNLVREMLTTLSFETAQADAQGRQQKLDGRLTLITFRGERIPIAAVRPLVTFGVARSAEEKKLSMMMEGSVFQVVTPDGDVFTLPLHEIRGMHAISEAVMQQIQAEAESATNKKPEPFGFAAFTSLAHGIKERPIPRAPDEPAE